MFFGSPVLLNCTRHMHPLCQCRPGALIGLQLRWKYGMLVSRCLQVANASFFCLSFFFCLLVLAWTGRYSVVPSTGGSAECSLRNSSGHLECGMHLCRASLENGSPTGQHRAGTAEKDIPASGKSSRGGLAAVIVNSLA
eukprot:scpid93115/ scgid5964/ 